MKLLDFGIFRISDSSAFFCEKKATNLRSPLEKMPMRLVWFDLIREGLLNVNHQPTANIQACGRLEKTTSCGLKVSCWSSASQCSLWVDMTWIRWIALGPNTESQVHRCGWTTRKTFFFCFFWSLSICHDTARVQWLCTTRLPSHQKCFDISKMTWQDLIQKMTAFPHVCFWSKFLKSWSLDPLDIGAGSPSSMSFSTLVSTFFTSTWMRQTAENPCES